MSEIFNNENFIKDKYKFSLVSHNLDYSEHEILSDGSSYAIVIGKPNKEIWIWTDDNIKPEKYQEMFNHLTDITEINDYSFVCTPEVYDYLKYDTSFPLNEPFVYDNYICNKPIEPKKCDAVISRATLEDKDTIAIYWKENCEHFGYNDVSLELCLRFDESWIASGNFYVLKNSSKIVSFLGYDVVDKTAEISHAYTAPSERGKGYMPYLIYNVSKLILGQGLTPVLNTDYSYTSSNNAYKKVGFEETGLMYSFSSARHLNKKNTMKR